MESNSSDIQSVTLSDILDLASWNRKRSVVELKEYINRRDEVLDVEDFDLE